MVLARWSQNQMTIKPSWPYMPRFILSR